MRTLTRWRVAFAFLLAPLPTIPILALGVWLIFDRSTVSLAGLSHASFFFAIFGLPIAYLVEASLGLVLHRLRRNRPAIRRRAVIAIATIVAALGMPSVWWFYWRGPLEWRLIPVGAAMGAAAGVTFALVAFGWSDSRPAI